VNVAVVLELELEQPSLDPVGGRLNPVDARMFFPTLGASLFRRRPIEVSCGVKFTSPTFGSESVFTGQRSSPHVTAL
jgi:hypothetical protein